MSPSLALPNAQEIFVFGTRIRHSTSALHLDNMMRPKEHDILALPRC
jgi:hypothetical protein